MLVFFLNPNWFLGNLIKVVRLTYASSTFLITHKRPIGRHCSIPDGNTTFGTAHIKASAKDFGTNPNSKTFLKNTIKNSTIIEQPYLRASLGIFCDG